MTEEYMHMLCAAIESVATSLGFISTSIDHLSEAVIKLGLNDAGTGMGAIELLAMEIKKGADNIASATME